jgi:hypothetical protein
MTFDVQADPVFDVAPEARQWTGDHAGLWRALGDAVSADPDGAAWFILPTGTRVVLRASGARLDLTIYPPAFGPSGTLRNVGFARWAGEVDAMRTAFGVREWRRVDPEREDGLHYVNRARERADPPQPAPAPPPAAAPASPPQEPVGQFELLDHASTTHPREHSR